jgi:hypothetical protein
MMMSRTTILVYPFCLQKTCGKRALCFLPLIVVYFETKAQEHDGVSNILMNPG